MERTSTASRLLTALLILALAAFSVGFTWAAVDDYARRDILPAGAAVAGVPIGGMSIGEATRVVTEKVAAPLLSPVTVGFMNAQATIDPSQFASINVKGAVIRSAQPKESATLPERTWQRLTGASVGHDVSVTVSVDEAKLRAWAKSEKKRATVPAIDASVTLTGSQLHFVSAKAGSTIDAAAAVQALSAALRSGTKTVQLAEAPVQPKITDKQLGKTILVSRSRRSLTLYANGTVEKSYSCAVGQPQYPTPLGWWKIVRKAYLPSWHNSGSAWAASMPAYIGPGPNNPLGTRALYLNASGIRIHGVPPGEEGSIGSAASHGCMRMHRADIENLYPRVPIGTRVIIIP